MDAEYRERTNLQLKEMVVAYKNQVEGFQRQGSYYRAQESVDGPYSNGSKYSLRRYEKLLSEADNERASLLNEISLLSKENYQLRV